MTEENVVVVQETSKASGIPSWLPWVTGGGGLFIGLLVGLAIPLTIGAIAAAQVDTRLIEATDVCGKYGISISEDGQSLTLDVQGNDDITGASWESYDCLTEVLEMPEFVISHIDQTTARDGRQSEVWDGIEFSWSYHPDRGLDGVFRIVQD